MPHVLIPKGLSLCRFGMSPLLKKNSRRKVWEEVWSTRQVGSGDAERRKGKK
jgi:hypothetical protein